MSSNEDDFDLELISSDDELLDALGSGMMAESVDHPSAEFDELLSDWRSELAGAGSDLRRSVTLADATTDELDLRRGRRSPRRALAIGALGLSAVLTMTGTAAAFSGTHGPLGGLHRALFGGTASQHTPDVTALRAQTLLEQAAVRLAAGSRAGGLSLVQRTDVTLMLTQADALLRGDSAAPRMLVTRAANLRAALNDLPTLTPPLPADRGTTPSAVTAPEPSARVTGPPSVAASRATSSVPAGTGPVSHSSPEGAGTGQADSGGDSSHPSAGSDLESPAPVQPSSASGSGDGASHGGQQPSSDGSQSSGDTGQKSGKGSSSGSGDSAVQGG